MNDRELLELAAKAATIEYGAYCDVRGLLLFYENPSQAATWNPLNDDGDALRLAVKLDLLVDVMTNPPQTHVLGSGPEYKRGADVVVNHVGQSKEEATRRAIVRAAAEIGKEMK